MALKAKIKRWLKQNLSAESYQHTLGTAKTASRLAKLHGFDEEKAELAALLHDVAKEFTDAQLLSEAKKRGLQLNKVEVEKPYLIHAKIGAEIARELFQLADIEIEQAVKNHTYGRRGMTGFEKLIYLADVVEPGRQFQGLEVIRQEALVNLNRAFALAYQGQLIYLISEGKLLHPVTLEVWNELVEQGALK